AGLQLAALSLSVRSDERAFAQAFQASNRHVMDYLMDEVLASQPPAVQAFLLRTAIVERFCAPLCEAIVGGGAGESDGEGHAAPPSGQPILAYLEQANLFLVPLDEQGMW